MTKVRAFFIIFAIPLFIWGNLNPPWDLWQTTLNDFNEAGYLKALQELIPLYEKSSGITLKPLKKKIGLKVYTGMGKPLSTPLALTQACIQFLKNRGFREKDILIIDFSENSLREAGYLPPLSKKNALPQFQGVAVCSLEKALHPSSKWYYESSLLPLGFSFPQIHSLVKKAPEGMEDYKKSYLPTPLMFEVDYWINLPVALHQEVLGISGAVANASLYCVSNYERFLENPTTAGVAAAEIAAIPELRKPYLFTLLSCECMQYAHDYAFNAFYSACEKTLLLSYDLAKLDKICLEKFNDYRARRKLPPLPTTPPILKYALELGLGKAEEE